MCIRDRVKITEVQTIGTLHESHFSGCFGRIESSDGLSREGVYQLIVPSMMMGANYEGYLLGTAFARPIIARRLVEIAKKGMNPYSFPKKSGNYRKVFKNHFITFSIK